MVEDYTLWYIGQIKFLLKLVDNPNNMAVAESKSEGGSAKELRKKGYIAPFGKVGRAIRWKIVKSLSQNEIKMLRELAK